MTVGETAAFASAFIIGAALSWVLVTRAFRQPRHQARTIWNDLHLEEWPHR